MNSSKSMPILRQQTSRHESVKDCRPRTPASPEQQPREIVANENQRQPSVEHDTPDTLDSSESTQEGHTDDDNEPISTWRPEHTDDENKLKSTWSPATISPASSPTRDNSSGFGNHHPSADVSQADDLEAPPEHIHDGRKPRSKFSRMKKKMTVFWKFIANSPVRLFSRRKRPAL